MATLREPNQAFDALLFDMDGTVLTSIAATERVWARWAERHGLDITTFLPTIHGRRAIDTVRASGVTHIDPEAEAAAILEAEIADVEDIEPIAGAPAFLASLPRNRWAIVTSAPRRLAERRIEAANLPLPDTLISGDDVARGKPAPDGYKLAAECLGINASNCLIFEDAAVGVRAAEAIGASVVTIVAPRASTEWIGYPSITDYRKTSASVLDDGRLCVDLAAGDIEPGNELNA